MSASSSFSRHVRAAFGEVGASSWRVRGSGLIRHHDNGYWAQITFLGASRKGPRLRLGLVAGVCSPYLLRYVNEQDLDKPPGPNFVAASAAIVWDDPVEYSEEAAVMPARFDLVAASHARQGSRRPTVLGKTTAEPWLADAFSQLMPSVDALCTDSALRDFLIDPDRNIRISTFALRNAALLTRKLGQPEQLEAVLTLARKSEAAANERVARRFGDQPTNGDDQDIYPQDWSHARFVRFMNALPHN